MRDRSGKYELVKRIGRGGTGQVWFSHFHDGPVNRPCAVKVLHADLAGREADKARFEDEAKIASGLRHRAIVHVTGTGTYQGSPFMAMEWVDGVNLHELLKKAERLEDDVVCYIVGEVLDALVYAHERTVAGQPAGVIHHDVTPGNVLVSSSGEVKLTDFGIARFASTGDQTLVRAMGTPRYMSIEQRAGRASIKTDIYSIGVVLHELLDGKHYLAGKSPQEFEELVLDGHVPALERTDVPEWLDALRRQMLSGEPGQRPRAADARHTILEHCLRYHLAGEHLRDLYGRVVGARHSGFTDIISTVAIPEADPTLAAEPTRRDLEPVVVGVGRSGVGAPGGRPRALTKPVWRAAGAGDGREPGGGTGRSDLSPLVVEREASVVVGSGDAVVVRETSGSEVEGVQVGRSRGDVVLLAVGGVLIVALVAAVVVLAT